MTSFGRTLAWFALLGMSACDDASPSAAKPAPQPAASPPSDGAYPLDTHAVRWKVGDVGAITFDGTTTTEQRTRSKRPDTGVVTAKAVVRSERVLASLLCRAEAVDADGAPTRCVVDVDEWTLAAQAKEDDVETPIAPDGSLRGVRVLVERVGGVGAWTVLTSGAGPSEGAVRWLDAQFRSTHREGRDLDWVGRPPAPVRVGQQWLGDPAEYPFPTAGLGSRAKILGPTERLHPDPLSLPVVVSLVEARAGGSVRVDAAVSLKLARWQLSPGVFATFRYGGEVEGGVSLVQSLEPGDLATTLESHDALSGTAYLDDVFDTIVDVGQRIEEQRVTRRAGTMPEPAGAK